MIRLPLRGRRFDVLRILKNADVVLTDDDRMFVVGDVPDDEDEGHDCEVMGCGSACAHILMQGSARVIGVSVFDATTEEREPYEGVDETVCHVCGGNGDLLHVSIGVDDPTRTVQCGSCKGTGKAQQDRED
jgi:hypothetical protein